MWKYKKEGIQMEKLIIKQYLGTNPENNHVEIYLGHKFIGCIDFWLKETETYKIKAIIDYIGVNEQFRRLGIGTWLISEVLNEGVFKIEAEIILDDAYPFYKDLGFRMESSSGKLLPKDFKGKVISKSELEKRIKETARNLERI